MQNFNQRTRGLFENEFSLIKILDEMLLREWRSQYDRHGGAFNTLWALTLCSYQRGKRRYTQSRIIRDDQDSK